MAMNYMSYSSGSGELQYSIPKFWATEIRDDGTKKAFFGSRFEGGIGSNKPIIVNTDFTKGPGDTLYFQMSSELFGPGVTGENTMEGSEEKLTLNQISLTVDWIKNAISFTAAVSKRINFDIQKAGREKLSNWLARHIDDAMFTALISGASSTIYGGAATTEATLGTTSRFGLAELSKIKTALERTSIAIKTEGAAGEEEEYYGCVISEIDAYWLKQDPDWREMQLNAGPRDYAKNKLFSGALGLTADGMIVYVHKARKSARNVQGSPLRPEGRLHTTLDASSTGANNVLLGASTITGSLTKFFASSGTIRIDDEDITYTSKSIYGFTTTVRGANNTTAAAHTAGALVTQRDVATVIGFGAEIAIRGWGMKPVPIKQGADYEIMEGPMKGQWFINGLGVAAVFGQTIVKDSAGDAPNYLLMKTYADNPGSI